MARRAQESPMRGRRGAAAEPASGKKRNARSTRRAALRGARYVSSGSRLHVAFAQREVISSSRRRVAASSAAPLPSSYSAREDEREPSAQRCRQRQLAFQVLQVEILLPASAVVTVMAAGSFRQAPPEERYVSRRRFCARPLSPEPAEGIAAVAARASVPLLSGLPRQP